MFFSIGRYKVTKYTKLKICSLAQRGRFFDNKSPQLFACGLISCNVSRTCGELSQYHLGPGPKLKFLSPGVRSKVEILGPAPKL